MKAAAMILGLLFFGLGNGNAAEFVFGQNSEPTRLNQDISITRVSIKVSGFFVGGFADYCLELKRDKPPLYSPTIGRGGYIEPMCFNTVRTQSTESALATLWRWAKSKLLRANLTLVPAGDWEQQVELSNTPIFVPDGTLINCGSLGALSSTYDAKSLVGTCTVEYQAYEAGDPRFRLLRMPYYDQFFHYEKPLITSYLRSFEGHALHISGAVVYIGNNNHGSQMEACLTKERNGKTIGHLCFPPANQDSPGQVFFDWTINKNERVGLDCYYPADDRTSSGDCAAYLIVKLPDDLERSPENAFRDYGELPRDYVQTWCEQTAHIISEESMHDPKLCLGKDACSFEEKMANCRDAFEHTTFPRASCMADSSCYSHSLID
ncbi:hypothetical protein [Ollibium composti]|uniref:Uncharacterized protein n=1 Tax=Ollibium composti TaxID=2675109 RepID=A0ABY2Q837_9HYPH|nr:hypothetical protein [Mesorhizobium composti]THF56592.1 hypothetical protein E6C48_12780 [Mesorhizobium composti]